jgi:serralysin
MTPVSHICLDRRLPPALLPRALAAAREENPANAKTPLEAAAFTGKLWAPGRILEVQFLDGDPVLRRRVADCWTQWTNYANLDFRLGAQRVGDIRISFNEGASWSALGTDALVDAFFPENSPTMNLGWLTPESSQRVLDEVVLHEFGHALGLVHEHQNPAARLRWNREAVYRDMAQEPNCWDEETVDRNFFAQYNGTVTNSEFDPQSIMLYDIPQEWLLAGGPFVSNWRLSDGDKAIASLCYPS